MSVRQIIVAVVCLILVAAWQAGAAETEQIVTADSIMKKVEARYDCESLVADFTQVSILKAMDLTDTAHGKVVFKRPDKVRWEYETPSPQMIISNGDVLWVYKPEENQVVVGEAESLMGRGKGVSFLVDIFSIRDYFETHITDSRKKEGCYVLRLEPLEEMPHLSDVHLFISQKTYHVLEIELTNAFDEITSIVFDNIKMDKKIDDSEFEFEIPIDAEVIALDVQI